MPPYASISAEPDLGSAGAKKWQPKRPAWERGTFRTSKPAGGTASGWKPLNGSQRRFASRCGSFSSLTGSRSLNSSGASPDTLSSGRPRRRPQTALKVQKGWPVSRGTLTRARACARGRSGLTGQADLARFYARVGIVKSREKKTSGVSPRTRAGVPLPPYV